MPTVYKGLTIPITTDLADGPKAFQDFTDSLPNAVALDGLEDGSLGPYRIFATAALRDAWIAPNGSMAVVSTDNEPYLRVGNAWRALPGRVWEFAITQSFAAAGFTPINISPAVGALRPDSRKWKFDLFLLVEPITPPVLPATFTLIFNANSGASEQTHNVYAHTGFEGIFADFAFTGNLTSVEITMNNNMRVGSGGRLLVTDGGMA